MKDDALKYIGRGFRILPLIYKGKSPPFKTGKKHAAATRDPAKVEEWFPDGRKRNIGTVAGPDEFNGRGLFALDVDGPSGVAELGQLLGSQQLPRTWQVRSGRETAGRHIYYHGHVRSSSANGLEVRSEGKILVLPPSMHKSGRLYEVIKPEFPIADAPEWLINILNERESSGGKRERKQKHPPVADSVLPEWLRSNALPRLAERATADFLIVEPDDLMAAAAVLPNPDLPWESPDGGFNEIGLALWRVSGGQPYGLAAFKVVAAKSKKKWDGGTECEERWAHYPTSKPTEYTFGSILFWIHREIPGWQMPSREPKVMQNNELPEQVEELPQADEFFKPQEDKANGHKSLSKLFNEIDLDKPGNPLIKLNEKYAAIGDLGGKCLVMSWVESKVDRIIKVPSFQNFKSFSERYMHKYVMVKRDGKDGEIIEEAKSLGSHWLKWGHRRTYEGIDLVPNGERELAGKVLNLWQGFAIKPKAGGWPLMRAHILDVLADGDKRSADYIARWAAWSVQHPGERAEAALVLKGGKGSGKGTFADAMRQIFGQHGLHIFNSKHLVGAFNGHLRNCLFLFADEAFWAGDKHGEAVLKGMLTEPVLMIEQKGIDATAWKNRLHVIMAANAEWVVPASHDERRYAVFEVSSARMGDEDYFARLRREMTGGGLPAMLYDLLHVDLKDWHPRKIVRTAALAEQKARSLDPRHEWWESVLQSGVLPGRRDATDAVPAMMIYERARQAVPRLKEASETALGRFLRQMGAEGLHRENGNYWRFPTLSEARATWNDKFGFWPWRNELVNWHG